MLRCRHRRLLLRRLPYRTPRPLPRARRPARRRLRKQLHPQDRVRQLLRLPAEILRHPSLRQHLRFPTLRLHLRQDSLHRPRTTMRTPVPHLRRHLKLRPQRPRHLNPQRLRHRRRNPHRLRHRNRRRSQHRNLRLHRIPIRYRIHRLKSDFSENRKVFLKEIFKQSNCLLHKGVI